MPVRLYNIFSHDFINGTILGVDGGGGGVEITEQKFSVQLLPETFLVLRSVSFFS
jgi:hypothetical protein